MSETKKQLGGKSRLIGKENRETILFTIAKQPVIFKELVEKCPTIKSRATLSKHLKDLQEDGIIEKAISNGKVVYQIKSFDEETVLAELKIGFFDSFSEILSLVFPSVEERVIMFLKSLSKEIVQYRKDVIDHGEKGALKRAQKRFQRFKQEEKKLLELKFVTNNEEGEK